MRAAVPICLLLAACGRGPEPEPPRVGRPVVVARVVRDDVEGVVRAVGETRPLRDALLAAETTGRVVEILEAGRAAAVTTPVARLDPARADAALAAALARAASAEADVDRAESDMRRVERLGDNASQEDRDHARTALAAAAAAAEAARAAAEEAGVAVANCAILAPFDGVVLERRVELGEVVSPGTPIVRFGIIESLEIAAFVGEEDAMRVRPGADAAVTFDSLPGREFTAEVLRVSRALSTGSRTAEVTLRLDNPDGRLPAGMLARVTVQTERREGVLTVPPGAIRTGPDGASVWIVNDDRAHRIPVTVGLRGAGAVEILEGLEAGRLVVVRGGENLADGDLVQPAEP